MAPGNANFEIHVMRDGRWALDAVRNAEADARALAHKYLADKKCEGARVIRNWMRADGKMVEAEVFCETRTLRDDTPVRIVAIEDAPPKCDVPNQYYAMPSRMVMNRLFRHYFDKTFVTPTEIIHNYRELKRIQDKDTLVPSAIDRVAALQTRDGDQDARARREDIFRHVDQMTVRARDAANMKLPKLNGCFADLRRKVSALADKDDDRDFLALVALSRELVTVRDWAGKLDRLCRLAVGESDPHVLEMVDGVIADVLGANVVQELLGWQPGLGHAIMRLLDLADGILPTDGSEIAEIASMLTRLLRERKLPASRLCLQDRALRQLRSANPLYRNDPAKEKDTFAKVAARLITSTGMVCGPDAAAALTTRYTRMVEEGGAVGRRAAIAGTFGAMPDRATGMIYLAELAGSPYVDEHLRDIVDLTETVCAARRIGDLCRRDLSPKDRMQRATNVFAATRASRLPEAVRTRVMKHIDEVLERFLIEEKIIERLDHHESPLRDRAMRLVQFCASGVLPDGKALALARERIVQLLRQPDFDAHFVEGASDGRAAQQMLRDFHLLLTTAGFA